MTAQYPAAPETDVSALTEAERAILEPWFVGDLDAGWPGDDSGLIAAVGRIVAERVRVVEGERDAAQALLDRHWMRYCLCSRADQMHDRSQPHCPHHGKPRYWQTRAESAEAALDALWAEIEALADEWEQLGESPDYSAAWSVYRASAHRLRALLPGDGR